jgi:NAD(P)-dependent dehydrogenase (short-subunit alcohol dehydrogenase family)
VRKEENTFLVAGGSSGLGEATARMLTASGARVVVADLKGEAPEGGRFVDTDEGSVRAAVNAALEVGNLRGAVNCVGKTWVRLTSARPRLRETTSDAGFCAYGSSRRSTN